MQSRDFAEQTSKYIKSVSRLPATLFLYLMCAGDCIQQLKIISWKEVMNGSCQPGLFIMSESSHS